MIGLSFLALALVSVQWVLVGYSLSFGTDIMGFIGGLDFVGLRGVGMDSGDRDDPRPPLHGLPARLRGDHPRDHNLRRRRG